MIPVLSIHINIPSSTSLSQYQSHRRLINTPTHKKPDPAHRVYRRARIPRETNRWLEGLLLALLCSLCLFPAGFMLKYFDGTVPITRRRRFLILPLWLDELVGRYTLQALGIGAEDDDDQEDASDSDDDARKARRRGGILQSDDVRVAHIEEIFERILTANQLKACPDDAEYTRTTPELLKRFHVEFYAKLKNSRF